MNSIIDAICLIIGYWICVFGGLLLCCLLVRWLYDWIFDTFNLIPLFLEFWKWRRSHKNRVKGN